MLSSFKFFIIRCYVNTSMQIHYQKKEKKIRTLHLTDKFIVHRDFVTSIYVKRLYKTPKNSGASSRKQSNNTHFVRGVRFVDGVLKSS